jgi:capsular polysaccharide transport system permease protein
MLNGLQIQLRVIYALVMREVITRYGRNNIGFFWLFVEPMLFTLGITALWSMSAALHLHQIGVVEFALTGYSSVLLWRNCAGRTLGALEPNLSLLYHHRVKPVDIFYARCALEVAGATISFLVLSVALWAVGLLHPPHTPHLVLIGWMLSAAIATALGLLIGGLSEASEMVERVWHVIAYLFFPLSGAVFMVDWLSESMRDLVLYIPMVHGLEMVRAGYFGEHINTHYDVGYMISCILVMGVAGISMIRFISHKKFGQ